MGKIHTTLSIDSDILKRAKARQINISGEVNAFLRKRSMPGIADLPEEAVKLICTQCLKEIEYGFYCEDRNMFLCQECQDDLSMEKCRHDERGNHMHIRVPGFEGQNMEYINHVKKAIEGNKRDAKANTE